MNSLIKLGVVFFIVVVFTAISQAKPTTKKWNDKEAMVKAMEWQEQHPIIALAPTDWTNGVYYKGVTKAYQATQDQKFLAALKTMGYRNGWNPLYRTHHADDISIAYTYLFPSTTRKGLVNLKQTKDWLKKHLICTN